MSKEKKYIEMKRKDRKSCKTVLRKKKQKFAKQNLKNNTWALSSIHEKWIFLGKMHYIFNIGNFLYFILGVFWYLISCIISENIYFFLFMLSRDRNGNKLLNPWNVSGKKIEWKNYVKLKKIQKKNNLRKKKNDQTWLEIYHYCCVKKMFLLYWKNILLLLVKIM